MVQLFFLIDIKSAESELEYSTADEATPNTNQKVIFSPIRKMSLRNEETPVGKYLALLFLICGSLDYPDSQQHIYALKIFMRTSKNMWAIKN